MSQKMNFFLRQVIWKNVEWVYCIAKFMKEMWRTEFKQNETEVCLFSSHLLLTRELPRNTAQRKRKQSRHDVNISTSVRELHPVKDLQSQSIAKYTITVSTSVHNYKKRSNAVYRQPERIKKKIKNDNLLLPGWCYLIKTEAEER